MELFSNPHPPQIQQISGIAAHILHPFVHETKHLVIEQNHHGRVLHHQAIHLGIILGAFLQVVAKQGFVIEFVIFWIGVMCIIWSRWSKIGSCEQRKIILRIGIVGHPRRAEKLQTSVASHTAHRGGRHHLHFTLQPDLLHLALHKLPDVGIVGNGGELQ